MIDGSNSAEAHMLRDLNRILPHLNASDEPYGITFINVEGRNVQNESQISWKNLEEAFLVCHIQFTRKNTFTI